MGAEADQGRILQEGALNAPESAIARLLTHLQRFFPSLPGSGIAQAVPGSSLWYWGLGYRSWRNGGPHVVFHSLPPA